MTNRITTLWPIRFRLKTVAFILFLFFSFGCVSSLLKEPPPKFSKDAILPEPSSAFERNTESSFPTWKHKATGVVMSVFSDCENPEASLNEAHRLLYDSVENSKLVNESRDSIGGKRIFLKSFSGEIEAQPIEIWTAAFRNESCVYVSSLSGHPKKPETLKSEWFQFIENIKFKK